MKPNQTKKKISISKKTIAILNSTETSAFIGGAAPTIITKNQSSVCISILACIEPTSTIHHPTSLLP